MQEHFFRFTRIIDIFGVVTETMLILWAMVLCIFFTLSSSLELLSPSHYNPYVMYTYLLAGIILLGHYLIRRRNPQNFGQKSKYNLGKAQKMESMFKDLLFRISASLASAVSLLMLIFPHQFTYFQNNWYQLADLVSMTFLITIFINLFFLIFLPMIPFLLLRIFLPKNIDLEERKKIVRLTYILLLTVALIYYAFLHITDRESVITLMLNNLDLVYKFSWLIKFMLGFPLIFWLQYLFLGSKYLKTKY